jgi:pyruvate/2-oxoglutarate dehydrogenase complex dihydrolipoamide dehydrogenase (E3) component
MHPAALLFIEGSRSLQRPKDGRCDASQGTTRQLRGTNVIVSTGTRATLEAISGLAEAQPLTHIEALELDQVPEHLLVIGGGYVGVELSQAMPRFGSKISVIDRNERLMSKEDEDVCEALRKLLVDQDIGLHLSADQTSVRKIGRLGDHRVRTEWNREDADGQSPACRDRPDSKHGRPWIGVSRC